MYALWVLSRDHLQHRPNSEIITFPRVSGMPLQWVGNSFRVNTSYSHGGTRAVGGGPQGTRVPGLCSGCSLIKPSPSCSCLKAWPPSRLSTACGPSPPTASAWRPAPASAAAAEGPQRSWEHVLLHPRACPRPKSRCWPPGQPPASGVPRSPLMVSS